MQEILNYQYTLQNKDMVFVTRSYDIQPKLSIDPMKSLKQIGEFHRMFDENYNDNIENILQKKEVLLFMMEERVNGQK